MFDEINIFSLVQKVNIATLKPTFCLVEQFNSFHGLWKIALLVRKGLKLSFNIDASFVKHVK